MAHPFDDPPPPVSLSGQWAPLPKVLYGTVLFSFEPVSIRSTELQRLVSSPPSAHPHQPLLDPPIDPTDQIVSANTHQVPLQLGDECYVFERYLPARSPTGAPPDLNSVWYRGYILTQSHRPTSFLDLPPTPNQLAQPETSNHHPTLLSPSIDHRSALTTPAQPHPLPDEPRVYLGIFPANHVQIRDQLDEDDAHRHSRHSLSHFYHRQSSAAHPQQQYGSSSFYHPSSSSANSSAPIRSFPPTPMEPLPEEDETDLTGPFPQAGDLQQVANKPSIPLPSLKSGDETLSGRDEPLIDEIACALREWYSLLYIHLHQRQYRLFHAIKDHIEALHMGRRQLLAQTLSTEEATQLRRDLVQRLVYGNLLQGLDIIVRHPDYGALVECDTEIDGVDSRSWISSIRMYVCQVKLAYFNQTIFNSPLGSGLSSYLNPTDPNSSSLPQSKLNEPNQIPLNAHLPNSRTQRNLLAQHQTQAELLSLNIGSSSSNPITSPLLHAPTAHAPLLRPKFYHVMLQVKSFMAGPCTEGELIECYFSLYNKSESRFLTEEFCLILNHLGHPIRTKNKQSNFNLNHSISVGQNATQPDQILITGRTMFKDLSQHDVQDSIFLVCKLVKNGAMKSFTHAGHTIGASGMSTLTSVNSLNEQSTSGIPLLIDPIDSPTNSFETPSLNPSEKTQPASQPCVSPDSTVAQQGMTFWQSRSATQSIRRPYGCAVVEIRQLSVHSNSHLLIAPGIASSSSPLSRTSVTTTPSGVLESVTQQYQMNIFSPVHEASFPTLHEDIISSRVKEFYGSGHLSSHKHQSSTTQLNGGLNSYGTIGTPRNESILIEMKTYYGDTVSIIKENQSLLSDISLTSRLGFPDVVFPDDARNEIYVKLWSGDFSHFSTGTPKMITSSNSGKNIEVAIELRTKTGQVLDRVISRGSGEPKVSRYNSMVYRNNQTPTWGELLKLDISSDIIEECHLFFTFRNRMDKPNRTNMPLNGVEKPFAFAFLPLFSSNQTFIPDGEHNLVLFKYEKNNSMPEVYSRVCGWLEEGQSTPEITPAVSKLLIPLKDSFIVRSFLCSTRHTQNEVLLKLMKWEELLDDRVGLQDTLTKLRFASEVEICKFLRKIFDALFGVLVSRVNRDTKEYDDLVFNALVTLLGIVSDRRFTNFKPVVDLYIDHHFPCTSASNHLISSLQKLLLNPTSPESAQALRSTIKVWGYLLRFIVRSRELQRAKDSNAASGGLMSDAIEAKFKGDLGSVLNRINSLMSMHSSSIIGTQTLAVQHYSSLIPELSKVFTPGELLDRSNSFCESISATKGKIVMWKLLLQEQIVMSSIFDQRTARSQLVAKLTSWVAPYLGEFVDYSMLKPNDSAAVKDSARVTWLEGIRISTAVIAVALDRLHEALIDPDIASDPDAIGEEHDNIEHLLSLLPKLLDSYHEFENPINTEAVQRTGTTASVISPIPVVFPSSYPFSLLNALPNGNGAWPNGSSGIISPVALSHLDPNNQQKGSNQNALGEIAIVLLTMIHLTPSKTLKNYLEVMMEVEGNQNVRHTISKLMKVMNSILKNQAFPANWLNVNIFTIKIGLKVTEIIWRLMEREFVPRTSEEQADEELGGFDSELWSDFFILVHGLCSSKHLIIENYTPQKRRAVWRLGGDLRAQGSKIFKQSWESIGSQYVLIGPAETATRTRCGGYQVQFLPGFVEPLLELCLSHHDEMRTNSVIVLYSAIISEYNLNGDFTIIGDEMIDKLDKLLGNSSQNDHLIRSAEEDDDENGQESKRSFVKELKRLFEQTPSRAQNADGIDEELKAQVAEFLESLDRFLVLLLNIRNLPLGDEFIDDRVIGTLKLMSFIRNIGRSGIYIHYVHRLVNFHEACGNFVEAGLALRLHADMYEWNLSTILQPMPLLSLPKQTAFNRKETLYLRILEFLSKGKAWENAVQVCKELQDQYEHVLFDYEKLSDILARQSKLYQKIVKTDRFFCEYFRVAFHGPGFPPSVQNRQFVYRGYEWEKYAAFCDRMHNQHPNATIVKSNTTASIEDLITRSNQQPGERPAQFLHITKVQAEPDRTSVVFTNSEVPSSVRSYYEHNATNTFSFSRPFQKDEDKTELLQMAGSVHMWVEKTFLVCEDAFPTVLKRSEVLEIRVLEISPIENAILSTEEKTRELQSLHHRYLALNKTGDAKLNTNPLSMILNSMVDAPAQSGVEAFRRVFLTPEYLNQHLEEHQSIQMLQAAIDSQAIMISDSLRLHQALCPPEMRMFHATLYKFFNKNFAAEISRLQIDSSIEKSLTQEGEPDQNLVVVVGGGHHSEVDQVAYQVPLRHEAYNNRLEHEARGMNRSHHGHSPSAEDDVQQSLHSEVSKHSTVRSRYSSTYNHRLGGASGPLAIAAIHGLPGGIDSSPSPALQNAVDEAESAQYRLASGGGRGPHENQSSLPMPKSSGMFKENGGGNELANNGTGLKEMGMMNRKMIGNERMMNPGLEIEEEAQSTSSRKASIKRVGTKGGNRRNLEERRSLFGGLRVWKS